MTLLHSMHRCGMHLLLLLVGYLCLARVSHAYVIPTPPVLRTRPQQRIRSCHLHLSASADGGGASQPTATASPTAEKEPSIPGPEVPEGSHDELMYALGVNLARQLGDVRPLVETGEELAQVAKGLLDTVIGRLEEDGQRTLLARRGGDLNELITTRA
jgi:hypothetical protein